MKNVCIVAYVLFALSLCVSANAVMVAGNGRAVAAIVVPDQAGATETFAAEELKSFLDRITGADFRIVKESESEAPRLLVGRTEASDELADNLSDKHMEAFAVRTDGDDVLLVGACDRATLWAVYSFLEEELGCRWLGPGERWTHVPEKSTVEVSGIDRIESPALDYRFLRFMREGVAEAETSHPMDCMNWGARLRVNIAYGTPGDGSDPEIEKRGGVRAWMTPHNLGSLVDIPKMYREHPEWLALKDGSRDPRDRLHFTNLCTSQSGVVDAIADGVIKRFDANPDVEFITLGPGDGQNFCECDECTALDTVGDKWINHRGEELPVLTERWLTLCNEVARCLEKAHPGKRIYTLAYHQTIRPPRPGHVRPEKNVMIQMANFWPNNGTFVHPIEHPTSTHQALFRENTEGWLGTTPGGVMIYQYIPASFFRRVPTPMPHKFIQDIRWARDKGMVGYEGQTNARLLGLYMLPIHAIGKAIWNPDLDADALIEDYCDHAFGNAAGAMKAFVTEMEKAMDESDPEMMWASVWRYLTPETLARGRELLDQALAEADDSIVLERIKALDAHFRYAEGAVGAIWTTQEAIETQDKELFKKAQAQADQAAEDLRTAYESGVVWVAPSDKKMIDGNFLSKAWKDGSFDRL